MSVKRTLAIVGLVLFGLALGLGGLEVALRLTGAATPDRLDPTYDRSPLRLVPDPGRQNPWVNNEDDFLRVAVIGDSFTNHYANQWHDGYAQRLDYLFNLNEGARPVAVRPFAANGTNTWHQRPYLDSALEWGADLVILGIYLNDADLPRDPVFAARFVRALQPWQIKLLERSRALAWIYLRYENARNNASLQDRLEYRFSSDSKGFRRFQRAIRYFERETHLRKVGFVAVIWPNMFALGPRYPLELAHQRIAEVLEEAKVPYLDLLDEFRDKSVVRMAAYPGVDAHPSEIGHRVAANAIFQYLIAEGHVDSAYKPRRQKHPMGERFWLERLREKKDRFALEKKK